MGAARPTNPLCLPDGRLYNGTVSTLPLHFIAEEITVVFDQPHHLEKTPPCPDGFTWRGETFRVAELLEEWRDYERRGRTARNMRPSHLPRAAVKGSWGVGRFCFRVRIANGRIFEIYYDRAPGDAGDRKGHWFLMGERQESPSR